MVMATCLTHSLEFLNYPDSASLLTFSLTLFYQQDYSQPTKTWAVTLLFTLVKTLEVPDEVMNAQKKGIIIHTGSHHRGLTLLSSQTTPKTAVNWNQPALTLSQKVSFFELIGTQTFSIAHCKPRRRPSRLW